MAKVEAWGGAFVERSPSRDFRQPWPPCVCRPPPTGMTLPTKQTNSNNKLTALRPSKNLVNGQPVVDSDCLENLDSGMRIFRYF